MSKKPITYVLMVVDMSGSMGRLAQDVRGGFNTYVSDLAKDDGRYRLSVTVFDTQFISLCTAAKLRNVPMLSDVNYTPRGMTALMDAIGKTITEFESTVTLAEGERVLCVVQTDGAENSSREYTGTQIAKMIADREAGGRWTFIYLGAGVDAWGQGERIGFSHVVNADNSGVGTQRSYSGITQGTISYASGASGQSVHGAIADEAGVDKTDDASGDGA